MSVCREWERERERERGRMERESVCELPRWTTRAQKMLTTEIYAIIRFLVSVLVGRGDDHLHYLYQEYTLARTYNNRPLGCQGCDSTTLLCQGTTLYLKSNHKRWYQPRAYSLHAVSSGQKIYMYPTWYYYVSSLALHVYTRPPTVNSFPLWIWQDQSVKCSPVIHQGLP